MAQFEYLQTYQDKTTNPSMPKPVTQPEGNGWSLHSWQVAPNNGWLILLWQRPTVDGT